MIFIPDPKYNPNFISSIKSSTKLGPGITVAKFLGGLGSRTQLDKLKIDTKVMSRQLYLQAEIMRSVTQNKDFDRHRLIVSEGIYLPEPKETVSPESINDYKQTGRAVVYQLIGENGQIDFAKTFDLAVYWKDYINYDKLILDYDSYDPSDKLSCQIIVVMPVCPESFELNYAKEVQTTFNTRLQSRNELLEILQNEEAGLLQKITTTLNDAEESINSLFDIDLDII